jgi:hypothetical protein
MIVAYLSQPDQRPLRLQVNYASMFSAPQQK